MMFAIRQGDCVAEMNRLDAGSVDLVFADPPFNIGYEYDVYADELSQDRYLEWSRRWMSAVHRVLRADGTFWLAIGDEYAAELKVEARRIGFHCRSWVIWYYTFGVNCSRKFTRSHAHLFHFVKDPEKFVFRGDEMENRVPSARQLVYNDNRANPRGRLPDDTWIIRPADAVGELMEDEAWRTSGGLSDDDRTWTLRPQDLDGCFRAEEDTWYFPRVAGTFKERAGFHGCQMPEQLLGRIIRTCSEPGALVLDPFSGSGTTAAVAKKLGRCCLAFDLSTEYVRLGNDRLNGIRVGDSLDGSPEPLVSAPRTSSGPAKSKRSKRGEVAANTADDQHASARQLQLTMDGVVRAFAATYDGYSADRVVADPQMNLAFTGACRDQGLLGDARTWNRLLFRLRKGGQLATFETTRRTTIDWSECDSFLYASEIAWRMLLDEELAESLDEILCDPEIAKDFDLRAQRMAPGYQPLQYRLAALKIRKQSKLAREQANTLVAPARLGKAMRLEEFNAGEAASKVGGVYVVGGGKKDSLYVGEAIDLHSRLCGQFHPDRIDLWRAFAEQHGIPPESLNIRVRALPEAAGGMLAWQTCLIRKYRPCLNLAVRS